MHFIGSFWSIIYVLHWGPLFKFGKKATKMFRFYMKNKYIMQEVSQGSSSVQSYASFSRQLGILTNVIIRNPNLPKSQEI